MSDDKKINPYTGLPDNLHDTFACIRVFEHPIDIRSFEAGRHDHQTLQKIDFPDGWELIYVGVVEKFITIYHQRPHHGQTERQIERVMVPTYLVGRRRDQYLEDLRIKLEDAWRERTCVQRELIRSQNDTNDFRKRVEQEITVSDELMRELEETQRALGVAETRAQALEQQLAELRSKL